MRTCVGCRQRAVKTDLVRVVVVDDGTTQTVVPDLRGAAPGRGAYLHPTVQCLERAMQRKVFGRALRAPGTIDLAEVVALVRGPSPVGEAVNQERWSTSS
ncbi:MAG: YlxR family protein [Nocardioidaceae bacterium]